MRIETLRLNTRVVTGNPVWPHIRKVAHNYYHRQYVFTGHDAGRVTADLAMTDDPGTWNVLSVDTHGHRVAEAALAALVAHVQADLANDASPVQVHLIGPATDVPKSA